MIDNRRFIYEETWLAVLVAISILFVGCSSSNVEADGGRGNELSLRRDNSSGLLDSYIIVDSATGVNYVVARTIEGVSIIPRYNPDGTLYTS